MEVQSAAAGGSADLLMECDEEEQEVWPPSPDREKEEEEGGHNEALEAVISPIEETDLPPVKIIPIPVQAVSSCIPPTHHNKVKSTGAPLGFKVNGRLVLLSGGNATELKLHSHPGGSASGFTKVQIHSPAAAPAPEADPTPIITGDNQPPLPALRKLPSLSVFTVSNTKTPERLHRNHPRQS